MPEAGSPATAKRATIASQLYSAWALLDILNCRNGWDMLRRNPFSIILISRQPGLPVHSEKLVTLNAIVAWLLCGSTRMQSGQVFPKPENPGVMTTWARFMQLRFFE